MYLFTIITTLIINSVYCQYTPMGHTFSYSPINSPLIGERKFGFELQDKVINPGMINIGSSYKFEGIGRGWVEQKPITNYGTESVYSRPLDMPLGKTMYEPGGTFRHTAHVTDTEFGKIMTEKTTTGLHQTQNFDPVGWTLEKQKPIYDSSKLSTMSTDKYNVFNSNCQDYTNGAYK